MKLPSLKRIMNGDYKEEYKELIDKLGFSLNGSIESILEAFNKNISLKDNIACTVKDLDIIVKDSTGLLQTKTSFKMEVTGKVIGIHVINAINNTDNSLPNSGIFLKYNQLSDSVEVTHAIGIPANKKYTLKVVAYI
jgi:hypothetical protein